MVPGNVDSAERGRPTLPDALATPACFRAELARVPESERDAWLDRLLGLEAIPEDGPALPRGCVPYLPCSVSAVLRVVHHAGVDASDVFVDVGSGVGRAAALVQLYTGASAIGLEIQPELARASRDLARRLALRRLSVLEGDAVASLRRITSGTVFFLFCPFSGARLERALDALEPVARARRIRVGTVDVSLPARAWLVLTARTADDVSIYESTFTIERTTP